MTSTENSGWHRLETKEEFTKAFSDKPLKGGGILFTLHSDGRILGSVGESQLTGSWYWADGYFCRTASLDGENLGLDCEIIEQRGNQMRYTRDKGNGETSIVDVIES